MLESVGTVVIQLSQLASYQTRKENSNKPRIEVSLTL